MSLVNTLKILLTTFFVQLIMSSTAFSSECSNLLSANYSYAGGTYNILSGDPIGTTTPMYATGAGYLRPLVLKYSAKLLGQKILEIGPLYHPVIEPTDLQSILQGRSVTYWEYDKLAAQKLREWTTLSSQPNKISVEQVDLNNINPNKTEQFDTVIISQVLNYVDYNKALKDISKFIKPGGKIIITNTLEQGDRDFFHLKKPQKAADIETALVSLGFSTLHRYRNEGVITPEEFMANKFAFFDKLVEQNPNEPYTGSEGRSVILVMAK